MDCDPRDYDSRDDDPREPERDRGRDDADAVHTTAAARVLTSMNPNATRVIAMTSDGPNGEDTKRAKHGERVDREKLRQLDLHWHDLRHEGACRLLSDGVDIRTNPVDARPRRHQADAVVPEHHGRGTSESDDGSMGTTSSATGGWSVGPAEAGSHVPGPPEGGRYVQEGQRQMRDGLSPLEPLRLSVICQSDLRKVARPAGLEPATPGLEGRCSIQLSYGRMMSMVRRTPHPQMHSRILRSQACVFRQISAR